MRVDKKKPPRLSLVNIPPEITCLIIQHLSSKDFISLRRVSKSFHWYFTGEDICRYAHRLYFSNSSEVTGAKPYPGFPERTFINGGTTRTRLDFDNAYQRTRNWKLGQPTEVEVIEEVADGSVGSPGSILVDPQEGLLVYQRVRGTLVLRDLNQPLQAGSKAEMVINLQEILGDCIMLRAHGLYLREGESIRLRMNRGMLLVCGEAHGHQLSPLPESAPTVRDDTWISTLWNWMYVYQA